MDSQDSTAQPSHLTHLHHPHRPLPLPPSHPAGVLLGPHSQSQQRLPSDSYPLANSNNAVNPTTTVMHQQNPGFPFNSILAGGGPKPEDHLQPDQSSSGGRGDGSGSVPPRKKRGRPPGHSGSSASKTPSDNVSDDSAAAGASGGTPSSGTSSKSRGRPPGPANRQLDALGPAGVGFTAHVITINAEEDIPSKIMACCEASRTVCVLSANGVVNNVILRRPAVIGGTTYECPGHHLIITLSGSYTLPKNHRFRSGSLHISMIGRESNVIGGIVGGYLKAASQVEVIIGSFIGPSQGGPSESAEEMDDKPPHDVDVTYTPSP